MMKSYNCSGPKKCLGCGAWLNNQPLTLGYTPKQVNEVMLCMSCYQIKHYQKVPTCNQEQQQQLAQILANLNWNKHLNNHRFLLIIVVDVNNLGFSKQLGQYWPTKQILLVLNKADLIPYQIKQLVTKFWVQTLKSVQIKFHTLWLSCKDKTGINILVKKIQRYQQVALVGNSGVGKSHLIQQLGLKHHLVQQNLISGFLNTTKRIIATKLKTTKVIDTPGVRRSNGIFAYLPPAEIKLLQTSKWSATNFLAQDNRVYYWSNYVIVTIASQTNTTAKHNVTFWGPKGLKITHQKYNNFNQQKLKKLHQLWGDDRNGDGVEHQFVVKNQNWFCLDDLGWIKINVNQPSQITFYLWKKVNITKI